MNKNVSVAIDGPAGAGKSTMARAVAKELGYVYVDTGAIYRTVGYYTTLCGIGPKDVDGVTRLIGDINIAIEYLENQNYSVATISRLVGFNSENHFRKVFTDITGTTPLKYRKRK